MVVLVPDVRQMPAAVSHITTPVYDGKPVAQKKVNGI